MTTIKTLCKEAFRLKPGEEASVIVVRYTKDAELRLRDHSETKNFPRVCDKIVVVYETFRLSFFCLRFFAVNREMII